MDNFESLSLSLSSSNTHSPPVAMIIGYTQRYHTVSEDNGLPGDDPFMITIEVTTERTSEVSYNVIFFLSFIRTATVESRPIQNHSHYDAIFGSRESIDHPMTVEPYTLQAGDDVIPPLHTYIRDDIYAEEEECYTVGILAYQLYIFGLLDSFKCNHDYQNATNFFCSHTICIEDDDG